MLKASKEAFLAYGIPRSIIRDVILPYVKTAIDERQIAMRHLGDARCSILIGNDNTDKAIIIYEYPYYPEIIKTRKNKYYINKSKRIYHTRIYEYNFTSTQLRKSLTFKYTRVHHPDLTSDGEYLFCVVETQQQPHSHNIKKAIVCKPLQLLQSELKFEHMRKDKLRVSTHFNDNYKALWQSNTHVLGKKTLFSNPVCLTKLTN
jgi:hypothetical protein